jgi:hypothetical protein
MYVLHIYRTISISFPAENSEFFGPAVFDIEHRARKTLHTHTSPHTHTLWRHSPHPKLPMVSTPTHIKADAPDTQSSWLWESRSVDKVTSRRSVNLGWQDGS